MSKDIVRHWRLNAQRYRLIGQTCPDCNQNLFPPRPVCPHCISTAAPVFPWNEAAIVPSGSGVLEIFQTADELPVKTSETANVQPNRKRRQDTDTTINMKRHSPALSSPLAL
jgi:hypothetical protein